jgi:hypothetical protein
MWAKKNRGRYDRNLLRHPSDPRLRGGTLTDDEWAHVDPLILPAKRCGNKRRVDVREVMNGVMYLLRTGCQWRAVPKDLPSARHVVRLCQLVDLGRAPRVACITCSTLSAASKANTNQVKPPRKG